MKQLQLTKPHMIVMVGLPGAGKSYFADKFSVTFSAPLVSADVIRNELFNEPTFNRDESEIIGRVANYMIDEIFKTGRTLLIDGDTYTRASRQALEKKALDAGYTTLFVWVQTDEKTMKTRAKKNKRPTERFEQVEKKFTAPNDKENFVVISGKHTYASQLKIVLRKLSNPRAVLAAEQPQPRRRKLIR